MPLPKGMELVEEIKKHISFVKEWHGVQVVFGDCFGSGFGFYFQIGNDFYGDWLSDKRMNRGFFNLEYHASRTISEVLKKCH